MVVPRNEVLRYQCNKCHAVQRFVQQNCVRLPEILKCDGCGGKLKLQPSTGILQKLADESLKIALYLKSNLK